MSRILILGYGPLPLENRRMCHGPGRRAWHFIAPLLEDGHHVCLLASRIFKAYPDDLPAVTQQRKGRFLYYSMAGSRFTDLGYLRELARQFNPDCVVGIHTFPSSVAADLRLDVPLWADLDGAVMMEAQMKAYVYDDDIYVSHFRDYEIKVLDRADHFSCVSQRQAYALIGELGLWGRLNRRTTGHSLVDVVPNACETEPFVRSNNVIRGVLAEEEDFVVLYSGGYNTWVDVDTLFHGLEKAMSAIPNLVFLSTGGQIHGHDDLTFSRFRQMVSDSKYQDRFHFAGWVPTRELPNYYLESDLAINTDRFCYEAVLGARHRILDWMRARLPCLTTRLPEIGEYLIARQAAFAYQVEDPLDLARQLIQVSLEPERLQEVAQRAHDILRSEFTYSKTTEPLRSWVESPRFAPDHALEIPRLTTHSTTEALTLMRSRGSLLRFSVRLWRALARVLRAFGLSRLESPLRSLGRKLFGLDRLPYRVEYIEASVPGRMDRGGQYLGQVTLRNRGRQRWLPPHLDERGFNISYHWRSIDGTMVIKEGLRTPIPKAVGAGASIRAEFEIQAPPEPGKYLLEIDVIREHVCWLGEVGNETRRVEVEIIPSAEGQRRS